MKHHHLTRAAGLAAVAAVAFPAAASASGMGNEVTDRSLLDTYSSFTIIDRTQSAAVDGIVTSFSYWAKEGPASQGDIAIGLADDARTLKYLSPNQALPTSIDPETQATVFAAGLKTITPAVAPQVAVGDDLVIWSKGTGVVPFDYATEDASLSESFSDNGAYADRPAVGAALAEAGTSGRQYAVSADICATDANVERVLPPLRPLTDTLPRLSAKQNSTVPLKVSVLCEGVPVVLSGAQVPTLAVTDPSGTVTAHPLTHSGAGVYQYNLKTKGAALGSYSAQFGGLPGGATVDPAGFVLTR